MMTFCHGLNEKTEAKSNTQVEGRGNVLYVGNVEEFAPLRATTVLDCWLVRNLNEGDMYRWDEMTWRSQKA